METEITGTFTHGTVPDQEKKETGEKRSQGKEKVKGRGKGPQGGRNLRQPEL